MFDLFPVSYQARHNGFHIGQRGLFYDASLNTLIIGAVTESGLKGRVIHNGRTQKDYDEGRYFAAWSVGYSYDRWDMHSMEYVGTYRNYTSLSGYLEFLEPASYAQIKAYFKTKELLKDNKTI